LHNAPLSWTTKKTNLLIASYLFYAAWNPPFVILLWISTVIDWHVAKKLFTEQVQSKRKVLLAVSVIVNLGLLGYFKYGGFLMENFQVLMSMAGIDYQPPDWSIVLPVGISFYTFQTMAYSLDVYLRRAEPSKSFLDFALFVTFFPQLVAGPIVRPTHLLPQFATPRVATRQQLFWGLGLMTIGLFQKIVVADGLLAPASDAVFGADMMLHPVDAWLLSISVCRHRLFRFLAALAHFIVDLAARLPVHPAWWQPQRQHSYLRKSYDHNVTWWSVAWRKLDLRGLGWIAWRVPRSGALAGEAPWAP
jgi:alginate O-acetyltransferase complex protein AlgI